MLERLFRDLAPFEPTLVGTFPLGLQVEGSDFDVACYCPDLEAFEHAVLDSLRAMSIAPVRVGRVPLNPEAVVVGFSCEGSEVEVFGQPVVVQEQWGFRHMIVEGRLLVIGGRALRERVRALKQRGAKTEPAFAQVLGLSGDPFEVLLELERWPTERLRGLVAAALRGPSATAIAVHEGERGELMPLFRIADDSEQAIAGYLEQGEVLVATSRGEAMGHVQMIDEGDGVWELKSLAVVETYRGEGLGRRLVEAGVEHARRRGARRVVLSTGAADAGALRFYQRLGFRMVRVVRDAFTTAAGYPPDLFVDGIRLLDQVWFELVC